MVNLALFSLKKPYFTCFYNKKCLDNCIKAYLVRWKGFTQLIQLFSNRVFLQPPTLIVDSAKNSDDMGPENFLIF